MGKLLYSKSFIVFLIIVLILVIIVLGKESYQYFRISQEIKSLEKSIEELEKENEELARMEKYFNSEDFLEKQARLKLNLAKPGERVIIIKTPEDLEQEVEQEQTIAKEISNIQKWFEYFLGKR